MTALVPRVVPIAEEATGVELSRLEKLLVLERHLAERFDKTGPGVQTAVLSKEMRECWAEIEELSTDDDASGTSDDGPASELYDRVASAKRNAEAAAGKAA